MFDGIDDRRDGLAAVEGSLLTMRAFEERHADDEFDGWHDSDVDPREHR